MNKIFFLYLFLGLFTTCKPITPKEERKDSSPISTAIADSLHGPMDTTVKTPPTDAKKEKSISTPHISYRICSPNFTLLAKPSQNRQIFYVSGFDHQEFKCWEELQTHAKKICNGQSCEIYYVDIADIKVLPNGPDLLDPTVLKAHGIGKFTFDGNYWELKGSSIWKRKGNGWSYYTTNNQFGG
jgi:hypothetical protein